MRMWANGKVAWSRAKSSAGSTPAIRTTTLRPGPRWRPAGRNPAEGRPSPECSIHSRSTNLRGAGPRRAARFGSETSGGFDPHLPDHHANVAQSAEHWVANPEVAGSLPVVRSNHAAVAHLVERDPPKVEAAGSMPVSRSIQRWISTFSGARQGSPCAGRSGTSGETGGRGAHSPPALIHTASIAQRWSTRLLPEGSQDHHLLGAPL